MKPNIEIHTDGSNLHQGTGQGVGGWACVLIHDKTIKSYSGMIMKTTSQRAELIACIYALRKLKVDCIVTLFSDSQYLVHTMTKSWKRNKNIDLWNIIDSLIKIHEVTFIHEKGHADNKHNNTCDMLARTEATKLQALLSNISEFDI